MRLFWHWIHGRPMRNTYVTHKQSWASVHYYYNIDSDPFGVLYNLCEIFISSLVSAVCSPTCQNEGICSAPNTCDCSGTGYMGDQCEIRTLLTSTFGQVFSTDRVFTVTYLVYYNLCGIIISFLSSAVCSQTCQNEGICSAPNICDCSGTGYMGDQCEIRMLLTSTVGQVFSTDRIFTVTHLV